MNSRYIADITIEAKTPLRLGGGKDDLLQDSPVQKDWNGLPIILGTSLAGMMRDKWSTVDAKKIFGYQDDKKDDGEGSRLIVSNALLLDENHEVYEDYYDGTSKLIALFDNLPIREHTAITDKGVAKKGSKFDEEVIFKGSRFKFRLEFLAKKENNIDTLIFEKLLNLFSGNGIRIGAGSTKGYGRVNAIEALKYTILQVDSQEYRKMENSLNSPNATFDKVVDTSNVISQSKKTIYTLTLEPDSFFMFGSGFGNEDNSADQTQVQEYEIDCNNGEFYTNSLLIPATSIKGAISHRTAYYYNKDNTTNKIYADEINIEDFDKYTGENNIAVTSMFGRKKETIDGSEVGNKGRVDFEDVFIKSFSIKIFDHNSIDRFTGGTIDGALFAEETVRVDEAIELKLEVDPKAFEEQDVETAFENALKDICTGMLPLGGMTTKGHGVFCGKLVKDDECLIDKLSEGGCDGV